MEARPDNKEERIVAAAKQLFTRFGPRKTTIDDIAQDAGLGKGTIYLYFRSKEEIFLRVVRHELQGLHARIEAQAAADATFVGALRGYMRVRVAHFGEMIGRVSGNLEILRDSSMQPGMDELRHEQSRIEAALLQSLIERGVARGELSCRDPEEASLAIVAMTRSLTLDWVLHGLPLKMDEKIDAMIDLLLNGLMRR